MLHYVVWWTSSDVSEKDTATVFWVEMQDKQPKNKQQAEGSVGGERGIDTGKVKR
jgi:hypothetical protein